MVKRTRKSKKMAKRRSAVVASPKAVVIAQPHSHVSLFISGAALALLVSIAAAPMVNTAMIVRHNDSIKVDQAATQRQRAYNDRGAARQRDRDYWYAMSVYSSLVSEGVIKPHRLNRSEPDTYMIYLDPAYVQGLVSGKKSDIVRSDAQKEFDMLLERHQDLLTGYVDRGFCPPSLKRYSLTGFYTLCQQLLEETVRRDLEKLTHSAAPSQHTPQELKQLDRYLQQTGDAFKLRYQNNRKDAE